MGKLFTNSKKEYQVHYKRYGNRVWIDHFDTLDEAEQDYLKRLDDDKVSSVELLECNPIKLHIK